MRLLCCGRIYVSEQSRQWDTEGAEVKEVWIWIWANVEEV